MRREMNEIKIVIHDDDGRRFDDAKHVWVYGRKGDEVFYLERSGLWVLRDSRNTDLAIGEDPTFTMPGGVLEALLAKAAGVEPRAHAVEQLLRDEVNDIREVRDRLLNFALNQRTRLPAPEGP